MFIFLLLNISPLQAANVNYANPLNVTSFTGLFENFLVNLQGVVGWLAVVMIVIGGVVYITSGGRPGQMTLAKAIIVCAIIGFAIAVAAPSLLREIRDIAVGFSGGASAISSATPLSTVVANIMNFMLTIVGSLALISFVGSGIMYIMSAGDSGRADTAKKMIVYSIIAVAVTGAGLIILRQVLQLLS